VADPRLRTAVEAASVIRRVTRSLLAALLPESPEPALSNPSLYDELAALSIVEATPDGLMLHQQVRDAVCEWLSAADPLRFHLYRRAAWRQIRSETGHAEARHRWRHTADMLYLLQDPGLREAYFPTGAAALAVEPAGPADQDAILAIAQAQKPARAAAAIAQWWQKAPKAFSVMRDTA